MAPPALAPEALRVSKVLAKAISASSTCISAAAVDTARLENGFEAILLKSDTMLDKSVTPS